ncbi:MAG: hypothetical protein ACFFFH_12245 [Candidatus Thorarchaeota archaeon]
MSNTIAWTRLSIYGGASLILITEVYRLILVFLSLVILAPSFFAFLQYITHIGLLLGFSCLSIGFFQLYHSGSALLNPEEYPFMFIRRASYFALYMSIILVILILLPPTTILTQDVTILFSAVVSFLWTVFYGLLTFWLTLFWRLENKIKSLNAIIKDIRVSIHMLLSLILSIFWLLETVSLILLSVAIFAISVINIIYIIF